MFLLTFNVILFKIIDMRKINEKEIGAAAGLLAVAFIDDPMFSYFFKNRRTRADKAFYYMKYELLQCMNYTYMGDENEFVAVYKKPGDKDRPVPVSYMLKMPFRAGFAGIIKSLRYPAFANGLKKKYMPPGGGYLKLIAVKEEFRGRGIAKKAVAELSGNSEAYLETQNPINVEIYKKMGFVLLEGKAFAPGVTHFCMIKSGKSGQ